MRSPVLTGAACTRPRPVFPAEDGTRARVILPHNIKNSATVRIMTVTQDALEQIAKDDLVTLPDLVRVSGVPRTAFRTAVEEGLITPSPVRRGRGRGGAITFTKEDAMFLLAVAALAALAGIAFVTMLKAMKQTGAQVNGNEVTINLPNLGSPS